MIEICDMTLHIPLEDLLSAIWYSDAKAPDKGGMDLGEYAPGCFRICDFTVDGTFVFIRLKRKDD